MDPRPRASAGPPERLGECPECGYTVTLTNETVPSHVPKGSRERKLCAASGHYAPAWNQPGGHA